MTPRLRTPLVWPALLVLLMVQAMVLPAAPSTLLPVLFVLLVLLAVLAGLAPQRH